MTTIVGIATVIGKGAISIIKVSGKNAVKVVNKVTKQKLNLKPNYLQLNYIVENNTIIDQVLISYFRAPKSYTGEDVIEINCHGGVIATQTIFKLLIKNGAIPAEPGEFTKRAFLNGKYSLDQVEAIGNIMNAENEQMLKASSNQLNGDFKNKISNLRAKLIDVIASIEVNLDYPEYDGTEEITTREVLKLLLQINNDITEITARALKGKVIKDGINAAIVGKPNVGKSSLLNALTNSETAIVSKYAGTTRDIITQKLVLENLVIHLLDTAGIRKTNDPIEQIGVLRSKKALNTADLIIFVYDVSDQDFDYNLLEEIKKTKIPYLVIGNKVDQNPLYQSKIENEILISVKDFKNINKIEKTIEKMFLNEQIYTNQYAFFINNKNINDLENIKEIIQNLNEQLVNQLIPVDLANYELREIYEKLGKMIGEHYDTEIIDQLFSRFCLGK